MKKFCKPFLGGVLISFCLNAFSQLPVANAGLDQQLQLPYNYADIYGGYSKAGPAPIVSYAWRQISGPGNASLDSALSSTGICHVTNMLVGTYKFELTVTDKTNLSSNDTMAITLTSCNYNSAHPKTITYPQSGTISQIYFPVNAQSAFNVLPGDTIKIDANRIQNGKLSTFEIGNIHGCPDQPITITNINGQVVSGKMVFGSDDTTRLRMGDTYVSYVNIMGNGTQGVQYGFKVMGGMVSVNFSSNMRLSSFEASDGSLGYNVKVNNQNGGRFTEKKSYPNWWMRDIEIDHSYVHNTGGEGMYLGDTDPTSIGYCTGCTFAVQGDTIFVHDNIVQATQWDGIQVSSFGYASIYKNSINNYGMANVNTQRTGIIIGKLTSGSITDNLVKNGQGSGIQIFGYDTVYVENNFLDSIGSASKENGLFANNVSNAPFSTIPGQTIVFNNNTVKYYNTDSTSKAFFLGNYQAGAGVATVNNNIWCLGSNPPQNWVTSKIVANSPGLTQTNNTLDCNAQIPYSQWPLDTVVQTVSSANINISNSKIYENSEGIILRGSPNPTSNFIQLSLIGDVSGNGIIAIYDQTGRLIKRLNINKQLNHFITDVDVSSFSAGIYFIKVIVENKSAVLKLVKY